MPGTIMRGMVAVYDTLARAVVPIEPAERALTIYSCGPTVYRYAHIGNLRTFLMADLVRRAFEYQGVEVHQVQNITDVGHMTDEKRQEFILLSDILGVSMLVDAVNNSAGTGLTGRPTGCHR